MKYIEPVKQKKNMEGWGCQYHKVHGSNFLQGREGEEGEKERMNENGKAYSSEYVKLPQNEGQTILVNLAGNSNPLKG